MSQEITIKDVKVWHNGHSLPQMREWRVYVHTTDGREGCRYVTGNKWQPKGSVDGKLTEDEWKISREIAYYDSQWHTVYEDKMQARLVELGLIEKPVEQPKTATAKPAYVAPVRRNKRADYCHICGHLVAAGEGELEYDVDAEEWNVYHLDREICKVNIEENKRADAERAEKEAREKAEDSAQLAAFEAAYGPFKPWAEVKSRGVDWRDWPVVASYRNIAFQRALRRSEVNGVECVVYTSYSYDNDTVVMRCADPERAGLERVEKHEPKTEFEKKFAELWRDE